MSPEQAATVTPGQAPPPVAFEDIPAVYVRWRRTDYPRMTEGAIAEGWRWKTGAEREFWTRLAPPPPRRTPELGAVAYEAAETGALRDELDGLRDHIDSLARGLDMSASTSHPSKKSEIERGCASALRGLLRIDGESGEETRQRLERERSGNELRARLRGLLAILLEGDEDDETVRERATAQVRMMLADGAASRDAMDERDQLRALLGEIKAVVLWDGTHQTKIRRLLELLGVFDPQPPAVVTAEEARP